MIKLTRTSILSHQGEWKGKMQVGSIYQVICLSAEKGPCSLILRIVSNCCMLPCYFHVDDWQAERQAFLPPWTHFSGLRNVSCSYFRELTKARALALRILQGLQN